MNEFLDPPLEALSDWVILEALGATEDQTPSGLVIPQSASKNEALYQKYRVVTAGAECTEDRLSELPDLALQPGDVVFTLSENCGLLRFNGTDYRICRFDSIAAIVRDEIEEI